MGLECKGVRVDQNSRSSRSRVFEYILNENVCEHLIKKLKRSHNQSAEKDVNGSFITNFAYITINDDQEINQRITIKLWFPLTKKKEKENLFEHETEK